MRTKLSVLIFFLSILPINFSCNENSTQALHAAGNLMPLAVGNTWIGRVQRVDTNGNVVATYYDTLKIIKDTTINNEQWFMDIHQHMMFRNTSWGLRSRNTINNCCDRGFLKYPSTIDYLNEVDTIMKTNNITGVKDTLIYGIKTALTDTTIYVPQGNYHCYYFKPYSKKLDGSSSDYEVPMISHYWYSPGYGKIKTISYDFTNSTNKYKLVWELIYIELH